MSENLVSRIRLMPSRVAIKYAEGLLSLLTFNPQIRLMYSTADLAYIESLAARGKNDPVHYNKGFDPEQPRDSHGKWTVDGRADIPKLSKTLTKYKTVPLTEDDVQRAVASFEYYRADYGDNFLAEAVEDKANALLRGKWSMEGRRSLAVLAWMADRFRRDRMAERGE